MTIPGPPRHLSRHRCSVCGGPMTVHDEVRGGTCADPRCRRDGALLAIRRREDAERDALTETARATIAPTLDVADPGSVVIGFVPSADQPVVPLPRRRRLAFRRHLAAVVAAAMEPDAAVAEAPTIDAAGAPDPGEETAMVRAGCSTCRGHCCRLGGTQHAFLDVRTIRRVLAGRAVAPDAAGLVDEYLALVPAASAAESCVFHGTAGCTVPRPMRADICNDFHCEALHALEQRHDRESGPSGTLIVSRSGSAIARWRHVDGNGTTLAVGEPVPRTPEG